MKINQTSPSWKPFDRHDALDADNRVGNLILLKLIVVNKKVNRVFSKPKI